MLVDRTCHKIATFNRPTNFDIDPSWSIVFLTLRKGEWTRDCDCPISDLQSFYIGGNERRVTRDAAESSASQPPCSLLGSQYPTIIIKHKISTFLFLELHIFRLIIVSLLGYINVWINLFNKFPQFKLYFSKEDRNECVITQILLFYV